MNKNQFKSDLEKIVRTIIANLDRGTVGISTDCLWQLVRIPNGLSSAPRGVNAPYVARRVFDEIVAAAPYNKFVYNAKLELL